MTEPLPIKATFPRVEVRTVQPFARLQATALKFYAEKNPHSYSDAEPHSDFANRITLNAVRHNLTNYDEVRNTMSYDVEALKAWRELVHSAIVKRYPQLTEVAIAARLRVWH